MTEIAYSEEILRAQDGIGLFCRSWAPMAASAAVLGNGPASPSIASASEPLSVTASPPRAVIVIAHGLADHSGRFTHVAEHFAGLGYAVYAYDHRGQGKSGGARGHVERFEQFYDDLGCVVRTAKERFPGRKLFLIGHSMGGLIVLGYASAHPAAIDGVIASSPCLELRMKVAEFTRRLVMAISRIAPKIALDTGIPAENLSHDKEIVADYKADEIRYPKITTRFYVEFDRAMRDVRAGAGSFSTPCLFMPGGADPICSTESTAAFYEADPCSDKKLVVWDGLFHEIFNEPEKDQVLATADAWICEREGRQ